MNSVGGPAAIRGFGFQHSLAAWAACGVLAERAMSPRWGLPSDVSFTFIRCETEQPLDDLMIGTSSGGHILCQITTDIWRSNQEDSKLARSLEQCVRQFHAYSDRSGNKPWERPLDPIRDRMLLATDEDAPQWFRVSLPLLLARFRQDSSLRTLSDAANTEDDRVTAAVLQAHITRIWSATTGAKPSAPELRRFFALLQADHFDFASNGRDRLAAIDLLRQAVLSDPTAAEAALTILEQFCEGLAANRDGADRPRLQEHLRRQPISLHVKAPLGFTEDIDRLKCFSKEMVHLLEDLSLIRVGNSGSSIKIQRSTVASLCEAAEQEPGHCLVVGEPGAGKSGVVYDFVVQLIDSGQDVIYLAADRIGATSDAELKAEWQLDHRLFDILQNWPGPAPGYLVIDALDAARSEGAARLLRDTIAEAIRNGGRWRVVASIRKFDLRYSDEIQSLFNGTPVNPPESDPEFSHVRHLNVRPFNDSELSQVEEQSPHIGSLISRARNIPEHLLFDLLRSPFNLRLVASLLAANVPIDDIAPMATRSELLDLYWKRRVIGNDSESHAREFVCDKICQQMVTARALQVDASLVPYDAATALNALKRNGVLVEWQSHPSARPQRSVLAFSHNVLFDFVVAKTLLGGAGNKAKERVVVDATIVLAIRPSYEMHFQCLWQQDTSRRLFWAAVLSFQSDDVPRIGQLIGPAVGADIVTNESDLVPLIEGLDSDDEPTRKRAERSVVHMAGALLAGGADRTLARSSIWTHWMREVSDRLSSDTVWAVRSLLFASCEGVAESPEEIRRDVNHVASCVFQYAWENPPTRRSLLPAAVRGICHTFDTDVAYSSACIRYLIDPDRLKSGDYEGLFHLADEIKLILDHDPRLVQEVYVAVFSAEEPPNTPVPMGDSQILPLTTTLRQTFDMTKYGLGQAFSMFLVTAPEHAIRTLCKVIELYVRDKVPYHREPEEHSFHFRGHAARIVTDASSMWDLQEGPHYDIPLVMLDSFQKYVEGLLREGDNSDQIEQVFDCVAINNHVAVVWRRLLRLSAEHPKTLTEYALPLVKVPAILACSDTRVEARDFLHAVYGNLDEPDRLDIERAVMQLTDDSAIYSPSYGERVRDRILGCLPIELLVTESARARLQEMQLANEVPVNEPDVWVSSGRITDNDDWYLDYQEQKGIPVREPQNARMRQLYEPVRAFAGRFSNDTPEPDDATRIWHELVELRTAVDKADTDGVHDAVKNDAIGYLAAACECLARNRRILDDISRAEFIQAQLLLASANPVPVVDDEENQQFDRSPTWSTPSARIDAAQGLPLLCRCPTTINSDVTSAIRRLSEDPANVVRYMIARCLRFLYTPLPDVFWEVVERMASVEFSSPILEALITDHLQQLPPDQEGRVVALGEQIWQRVNRSPTAPDVAQRCVVLFLNWYVNFNTNRFRELLDAALNDTRGYAESLRVIPGALRDILSIEPADAASTTRDDEIRQRAWTFMLDLAKRSVEAWEELDQDLSQHLQNDPSWQIPENTRESQKSLYHVLDAIGTNLYHASGAYEQKGQGCDKASLCNSTETRSVFLDYAEPVVLALMPVAFPPVTHHVVEFLAAYVDLAPERVFVLIAETILASEKGSYQHESLAVDLVVRTVERYLAEYRHVLRGSDRCQSLLMQILDIFVSWPAAYKLTYRLGEIYR